MAKELYLTYETKCRKCGELTEWAAMNDSDKTDFENWQRLHFWVSEHLNCPSLTKCKKCDQTTVQDYVAMSDRPIE